MSRDSRNPDLAAAFLEFVIRPENMLRHGEAFGTFPQKEEAILQAFADDEELASLRDHLEHTFGEQKHKYGRDLMPLVTPEIQAAVIGEKEPKQALDDAAAAVRELFAQG
jgi:multiple sugar transport system substrate-binding protein